MQKTPHFRFPSISGIDIGFKSLQKTDCIGNVILALISFGEKLKTDRIGRRIFLFVAYEVCVSVYSKPLTLGFMSQPTETKIH